MYFCISTIWMIDKILNITMIFLKIEWPIDIFWLECRTTRNNIRCILLWICDNANTWGIFGRKIWRKMVVWYGHFHHEFFDSIDPHSRKVWCRGLYCCPSLGRIRRSTQLWINDEMFDTLGSAKIDPFYETQINYIIHIIFLFSQPKNSILDWWGILDFLI